MGDNEASAEILALWEQATNEGMNKKLYKKIAHGFSDFRNMPSSYLLTLLRVFVNFDGELLYVNEIRNYLKENDQKLFLEYGSKFRNCRGCFEVFGIHPENIKEYDFKIEDDLDETRSKVYKNPERKADYDKKIRKQARKQAAENYKARLERMNQNKKKKEEIDRLIRKQDF